MNTQSGLLKTGGAALAALLLAGAVGAAQAAEGRRASFEPDGFRAEVQEVRHGHRSDRGGHRHDYHRDHHRDHRRHDYRGKHRFRDGHRYYAPPRFRSRHGHWKRHHHKPRHWKGRQHKPRHWWVPYGLRY